MIFMCVIVILNLGWELVAENRWCPQGGQDAKGIQPSIQTCASLCTLQTMFIFGTNDGDCNCQKGATAQGTCNHSFYANFNLYRYVN